MKKLFILLIFPFFAQAQNIQKNTPANYPKIEQGEDVIKSQNDWNNAKSDWIKNNPEEYRSMGGNPDLIISESIVLEVGSLKEPLKIIPFDVEKSFVLKQISVVPILDYVPQSGEVQTLLSSIEKDYIIGKMRLQFDANEGIRLIDNEKMNIVGQQKRFENNAIEWFFDNKDCPQCAKSIILTLEQESASQLVYMMKSEDESSNFTYRFTFFAH